MAIELTTAYWKIKQMTKKIKVIQGGQGASKNYSIAIIWFQDMIEGKKEMATIMTDTYDNLRDGAIKDFKTIFASVGLEFDDYYNKQEKDLHYNGSVTQFRHISDSRKTTGKS